MKAMFLGKPSGDRFWSCTMRTSRVSHNLAHSGDSSSSLSASVAFPKVPSFLLAVDVSLELS